MAPPQRQRRCIGCVHRLLRVTQAQWREVTDAADVRARAHDRLPVVGSRRWRVRDGGDPHDDPLGRLTRADEPDRGVDCGISMPSGDLTASVDEMIADDLNGQVVPFPRGHVDARVRDQGDRVNGRPRVCVDQAPARVHGRPASIKCPLHGESTGVPVRLLGHPEDTLEAPGSFDASIDILDPDVEQLIPEPERQVLEERRLGDRAQPRRDPTVDLVVQVSQRGLPTGEEGVGHLL